MPTTPFQMRRAAESTTQQDPTASASAGRVQLLATLPMKISLDQMLAVVCPAFLSAKTSSPSFALLTLKGSDVYRFLREARDDHREEGRGSMVVSAPPW